MALGSRLVHVADNLQALRELSICSNCHPTCLDYHESKFYLQYLEDAAGLIFHVFLGFCGIRHHPRDAHVVIQLAAEDSPAQPPSIGPATMVVSGWMLRALELSILQWEIHAVRYT